METLPGGSDVEPAGHVLDVGVAPEPKPAAEAGIALGGPRVYGEGVFFFPTDAL